MTMEKWKRGMSLAVVTVMLAGTLAACGTEAATPTTVPVVEPTATTMAAPEATATTVMAAETATTAMATPTVMASTEVTPTKPPAAPTVTPYPTVPQAAGSTKITFWYGLTGFNGGVVQQLVNKFNESQQQYYVEAIQQPNYDDTINKLNTSLAGGSLPNVVQIYDIGTQRMIDTKRIVPVQDFIDKEGQTALLDDLEPAVRRYYTINNKMYSMPFNSSAPVMYYDKNAFKEVGLDPEKPPQTYDEVIAAARKLVKKDANGNITRSGVDFSLYGWILEQEMATQGALLAEPDNGRGAERATKLVFNSEAGQNWLNFLKQLQDEGLGRSMGRHSGTTAGSTLGANFSKGEAAITFESIAVLRNWSSQAEKAGVVDVGVGFLPKPAGAPGGVIIGGASIWITNEGTSEQQQAGWKFVEFLASPESQAFFASNTGYYPTRKAAYDLPEMKEALTKYPQFQVAVDELRATNESPATAGAVFGTFAGARPLVEGAMEAYMLGTAASAKDALDEAASTANENLDEYNSTVKP
jgi:sn-glycerol 3-phosphate transport system substrate-binding protein